MKLSFLMAVAALVLATDLPPGWNPDTFRNESTLQFYTVNGDHEGHWSTVWVVVIDGSPYLRLGSRAATRVNGNANAPYLDIKIHGQEFDHVLAQSAPDMAEKVATAMADKYSMDVLVRHMGHPLTVRLVPAPPSQH